MSHDRRKPLLQEYYQDYLTDQDEPGFVELVSRRYGVATLERLATNGSRHVRRAAVFALGCLGPYESNDVLGRALVDRDRGVRLLAERGIRLLWCRSGSDVQRKLLGGVVRLNDSQRYDEAVERATALIEQAPWFAEAWNQRAVAYYGTCRYSESIRDCQRALEINPYHFGAAAGIGQCYLRMGHHQSALESFRRALRLNPNMEGVRANVVYLQRLLKRK